MSEIPAKAIDFLSGWALGQRFKRRDQGDFDSVADRCGRAAGDTAVWERLLAAQAGEKEACGQVLQQCRSYLLAVANQRLPRGLQAKLGASDIVQETLAAAHENFQRFTGATEQELLAWLRQILEYRVLTAERKYFETAATNVNREQQWWRQVNLHGSYGEPVSDGSSPQDKAVHAEQRAMVQTAIRRLQPEDREVIRLRNYELLTFVQIGERTGRTPDAVRKHWARAIERLQDELDGARSSQPDAPAGG